MPIIPLTCPSCGAKLEANSDDPILTCKYCGGNSVMKDAIVHNYIQNTVNITAGTVNVVNQKDFVIEGGVLKKYQGEAINVVIPDNVVEIGYKAFDGLRISDVKIPASVKYLNGFSRTGFTTFTVPDSVVEIRSGAFEECTELTSVTIPDSVKYLSGFYSCTALTSITIPNSVKYLDGFAGCTALTSITIPDSVTEIGDHAFRGCTALTRVVISSNIERIGSMAFSGCTKLTEIVFPKPIDHYMTYENDIFCDCRRIETITNNPFRNAYLFDENSPLGREMRKKQKEIDEKNLRRSLGKCQHCGGEFGITNRCRKCGRKKDY